MKRFFSWLVMIPFALIVIVFSAVNTELVKLSLWPLPFEITVPIFTLVLAVFIFAFIMGGAVAWLSAGRKRQMARDSRWRAESAERELHSVSQQLDAKDKELQSMKSESLGTVPAVRTQP